MVWRHLDYLLWLSLGIFLLFSSTGAVNWAPTKNANLAPFWQWISASQCMLYEPNPCLGNYKLNMTGIVYVPQEEVAGYCNGGCAEHIREVLECIHQVKRDFWFANKAHVKFINDSITKGCNNGAGINTTTYTSSAISMKIYKSLSVPLMSVLLMFIFNI